MRSISRDINKTVQAKNKDSLRGLFGEQVCWKKDINKGKEREDKMY